MEVNDEGLTSVKSILSEFVKLTAKRDYNGVEAVIITMNMPGLNRRCVAQIHPPHRLSVPRIHILH